MVFGDNFPIPPSVNFAEVRREWATTFNFVATSLVNYSFRWNELCDDIHLLYLRISSTTLGARKTASQSTEISLLSHCFASAIIALNYDKWMTHSNNWNFLVLYERWNCTFEMTFVIALFTLESIKTMWHQCELLRRSFTSNLPRKIMNAQALDNFNVNLRIVMDIH